MLSILIFVEKKFRVVIQEDSRLDHDKREISSITGLCIS